MQWAARFAGTGEKVTCISTGADKFLLPAPPNYYLTAAYFRTIGTSALLYNYFRQYYSCCNYYYYYYCAYSIVNSSFFLKLSSADLPPTKFVQVRFERIA